MDIPQQLNELETARDWEGLAEALEQAIEAEQDADTQAGYHLWLGRILRHKLLQAAQGLRHFQTAWKLRPASSEPLAEARAVYWELGKLSMVETVLQRSLEATPDGADKAQLLVELGEVSCDLDKYDEAAAAFQQAASMEGPLAMAAAARLSDLKVGEDDWRAHVGALASEAEGVSDPADKARLLLRAARVAHRFGADEYEQLLLLAYQTDVDDLQATTVYEEYMASSGELAAVLQAQRAILEQADEQDGPRLAFRYGVRWTVRHQNVDLGARLLEQSFLGDPENDVAYTYLRRLWGSQGGDWERVVELVQTVADRADAPTYLLAEAGRLCWAELGDVERARPWFERLTAIAPDHPTLRAFEAQVGEPVEVASSAPEEPEAPAAPAEGDEPVDAQQELDDDAPEPLQDDEAVEAVDESLIVDDESMPPPAVEEPAAEAARGETDEDGPEPEMADEPSPTSEEALPVEAAASDEEAVDEEAIEEEPADDEPADDEPADEEPADEETVDEEPVEAAASDDEPADDEPVDEEPADEEPAREQDDERVAQLMAQAEEQLGARRNHDYVRTLVEIAEALVAPEEQIEYYTKAAEVYQRFSNASEASKCFEAIYKLDPSNEQAAEHLRSYYEKRRDWESLIRLLRTEADSYEDADLRLGKLVEIAQLATDRIKKLPMCIELWSEVRAEDPQNGAALAALAMFYERARDWENLSDVLTELVETTVDESERLRMLEKLGQIQGDRLKNDEAAAEAWRQVLELQPGDRRAQENLKKKLLALGRWDDLELLYEESGKWDEFIRLLEAQESREKDSDTKIRLLLKVAELWETKKDKLDRAARAYEKILNIDADHLAAAEALIPIYADSNNPKGLANAIEVKLRHEDDGEQCLELLRQVAELYESRLRKPDMALDRYLQALRLAPANEQCAVDAERVAGATSQWEALVSAYGQVLEALEQPVHEAELRLRMGRVLLEELELVDDALEQYRAVYELDPNNGPALDALERLYRETKRHAELLEVYQKQHDLAQAPEQQAQVLYRIAALHEEELGDPASAIQTYRQALELDPVDRQALGALDRLYLGQEDWQAYADVLHRRLETDLDEAEIIDIKYRLGQTLDQHLNLPAAALESYREILLVDPSNDAGREALEGLLDRPELSAEVALILSEVYEGREQWDKLIGVQEILVGVESEPAERVGLLRKIAMTAAEQLGEMERAFDAQARALMDQPESDEVRLELEELAERGEAQPKLAEVFAQVADHLADADLKRDYLMRLAELQQQLGQVDDAAGSYRRVLEFDPSDGEALDALEALFAATGRYEELIGVVRRRIELTTDVSERERLFAQMATVYEEQLGQPDEAIAAYCDVLAFDESSLVALTALDGLYSRQNRHHELAENIEAQLRLADDEEAEIALMLRLSVLQETELGQVESAIETYRQVLERDPMNEQAIGALERLGQVAEHEVEIAEILEPLYRDIGDHNKLLGVYEVQVRRSDDPARRVELLHEMARLHEDAAGDLEAAFDTLARALQVDPASEATQEDLDRLARATDRFGDLARVYQKQAEAEEQPELAIELYTISARTYEIELRDLESAIGHYRRILELDAAHLPAIEALENIFRGADRYEELSQVLEQKAELLHDLDENKGALLQAAQIEEDILERRDQAVRLYLKVLDIDVEDTRALDALIKLYTELQKWPELLEVYAKRVELVFDADERRRIYFQMGAVHETEMQDVLAAIEVYQRVLEIDPDDRAALERLDALYQQAEDWPELLTVLQREAELAADPDESTRYRYRIAELYDRKLDDVNHAIELYRELLADFPDHAPTLDALEALMAGDREPVAAALVLEPVYNMVGEWHKLNRVLEVQVQAADDDYHRVELLHRIASVHEEMVGDAGAAFDTYARAVSIDLNNEQSLAQFERLASMVGRWQELAQLYDEHIDSLVDDPVRFGEIGLRLAAIYQEQLEDFDSAIGRYRRVLEVEPENLMAIQALDELYEHTERYAELAAILEREAELAEDPDEELRFKYRLGQVQQDHLQAIPDAIASYGEVLQQMPEHEDAVTALEGLFAEGIEQPRIAEILEPHYEEQQQFDNLAGIIEAILAHTTEPADRLTQYYRLAELHEQRLLSPDGALAVVIRALQEHPADPQTLDELERLGALVDEGWEQVANAYADVLGMHADVELQKAIGKRLARLFEQELQDVAKAVETYQYVLGVVPLEVECLENLDRIFSGLEQDADLAQVLEQRVQTTEEPYELVEYYSRLGEIYEERLSQVDDAVRVYRRIFDELEPANEQAQQALERLYVLKEAYPELLGVYERQLTGAPDDYEAAEIAAKMARVLADHLGDTARAVETWKRVLELRGEDGEALGALSELYERTEQWTELTEVLERHMALVMDDQEQVAVLLRRARLFSQQLDQDDAALDDYNRVLEIDFANAEALYAINDIWRRRENTQELLYALHQTIDRAGPNLLAEHMVALCREAATLHQADAEQVYEAVECWRQLLEIDPRDFDALAQLETLLRAEDRWDEVVDVKMMRARAHADSLDQVREYLEVAHIWEHQISNHDGATPALEAVLQIDPLHDYAFETLEKLHVAAERWEALIELYLARIETREDVKERTKLLRKVAEVFDQRLDDQEQAHEALQTAFELDFTDELTVEHLEKVTAAIKRWGPLIQLVQGWLEAQEERGAQITLSLLLAKWYADLGHPKYAQAYYQKVLQLDPSNVMVLRQMADFHKRNARWREQGQMLTKALEVASKDSDRAAILTDMGEVLEKHLSEPDQGISHYERAVQSHRHHLPALDALERVYGDKGMTAELAEILTYKAEALEQRDEREDVAAIKLRKAGLLETELGRPEEAAQVYQEVLEIDAANLQAMRGLERVHQAAEQWPALLSVLEMHLDVVTTERERIEVLMQMAALQEEQFLKADMAALRLEQVVEVDPNHEEAYVALARCYHRLRQWLDLIGCYERHIGATEDRGQKVELYTKVAEIHAEQLQDQERALDAYLNIVDLDPQHVPALDALAKLYERMDDPANAIEYMTRVADLTVDGAQRVEAFYRIGKQLEEKLGDRVGAQERLQQALDLDPTHLPSLATLRAMAVDEGDWDQAARYLDTEQEHTESPREKARLLMELGRLRDEMLDQHASAIEAYQAALQADPDNEDAALPLAREFAQTEQWEAAEPLAELLVRKSGKRERPEQIDLQMLYGGIAQALGKHDQALKAYRAAHKLDLTNQAAIRGLAECNFELRDWAGALTNYQKVLTALGEEDLEERAEVYYKLGCVKREQGQTKQAINNFEKGLALDPGHRNSLDALVAIYEGLGDWSQACMYRQQALEGVLDGDERFELLKVLADMWADKVGDPHQALAAFEQASDLRPDDHLLQHKMLQLYQSTSQWEHVVETLQRIAETDPQPARRARYLFTMAQAYRDKLDDPYHAAELFDEALDLNPEYLDAFKRVDKIFTNLKDWNKLERAYRKMIHRVAGKGNVELEFNLWHALGLIYRDRLGETDKAIDAFTAAAVMKPEHVQEYRILAELAEQHGRVDEALAAHRKALQYDSMQVDAYRGIYSIYLQKEAYDEAWCVAATLAFIKRANDEEQRFYEDWRPQELPKVSSRLNTELWWSHVFHEDEDRYIGKIFESVALSALKAKLEALKAKNELPVLPSQFKQDPASSTATFARTFWWAAEVLGIRAPELYARSDVPGGLVAVPSEPPASVAGQGVLSGLSTMERAFVVGRHLAMYRGEHYMKTLFPTVTELTVLLFSAIRLVAPETPAPKEIATQVDATAQSIQRHIQPMQREQLRVVVGKFLKEGARANIKRWAQCVETTAARAGLLLCGDLDVARKVIAAQGQLPGDLTPQERVKQLMLYSVSESYFELRSKLGLAINPNEE